MVNAQSLDGCFPWSVESIPRREIGSVLNRFPNPSHSLQQPANGQSNQMETHDAAAQDETGPFLLYRMITMRHESRHGAVGTRESIEDGNVRLSASLLTQCPLL